MSIPYLVSKKENTAKLYSYFRSSVAGCTAPYENRSAPYVCRTARSRGTKFCMCNKHKINEENTCF